MDEGETVQLPSRLEEHLLGAINAIYVRVALDSVHPVYCHAKAD
jgi:hypothetical protein